MTEERVPYEGQQSSLPSEPLDAAGLWAHMSTHGVDLVPSRLGCVYEVSDEATATSLSQTLDILSGTDPEISVEGDPPGPWTVTLLSAPTIWREDGVRSWYGQASKVVGPQVRLIQSGVYRPPRNK